MSGVKIVTSQDELSNLVGELAGVTAVAVDLEADNQHGYGDLVCLIQLSTESGTWLVDPLAVSDLSSLRSLLGDATIRKVFHDGSNDLRQLRAFLELEVRGLFDTMIACRFSGRERVGLADVLQEEFGVTLDKRFQRANWRQRPLPAAMVAYAAEDTAHLLDLASRLEGELREQDRWGWFEEECKILESVERREPEGPLYARVKGAGTLSLRQLGVLEVLLRWREDEARRRDRPPFKLVGNGILIETARWMPQNDRELRFVKSLNDRLRARWGRSLVDAVDRGLELPEDEIPRRPRPKRERLTRADGALLSGLKAWRSAEGKRLALDPSLLLSPAALRAIVQRRPSSLDELARIDEVRRWQVEGYGAALVAIVKAAPKGSARDGQRRRRRR